VRKRERALVEKLFPLSAECLVHPKEQFADHLGKDLCSTAIMAAIVERT
jgi:hypothetical protein